MTSRLDCIPKGTLVVTQARTQRRREHVKRTHKRVAQIVVAGRPLLPLGLDGSCEFL
jgi:hypothetical protein